MLNNIIKNNNGTYIPIDGYELIYSSFMSTVYTKEDEALKIYNFCLPSRYRIKIDIFNILKDVNYASFIKLRDYYFDKIMIGYNSFYIEHEENFSILEKDYEFVSYNLKELEKLILIFTELGIIVDDVGYRNYLCNDDNLILIDPDSYYFLKNYEYEIRKRINYKKFLEGIKDLYINSFKKYKDYKIDKEEFEKIVEYVFSFVENDINPVDIVCKKIKKINLSYY